MNVLEIDRQVQVLAQLDCLIDWGERGVGEPEQNSAFLHKSWLRFYVINGRIPRHAETPLLMKMELEHYP